MLLTALKAYAEQQLEEDEQTPPMYERTRVRYFVDLDQQGRYLNVVDLATEPRGPGARGPLMVMPRVANRGAAIRPNLLMDNREYALGLVREHGDPAKVEQRHRAFIDLAHACATATGVAEVGAITQFLDAVDATGFPEPERVSPEGNVAFRVDGVLPVDLPSVRAYWARISGADLSSLEDVVGGAAHGPLMYCLVCGNLRPTLRRIPFKHKGIPGGQKAGAALISANSNAFESYGLTESLTAPVCHPCAEAFSKGFDALKDGPLTHVRCGPLLYLFWSRTQDFPVASFVNAPEPDQVQELLRVVDTARTSAIDALSHEQFYAVSVAGREGRIVIRDWLDTTVGEAQRNLARFFRLQQLVDIDRRHALLPPLPVKRLADLTIRDPTRDDEHALQVSVVGALYRVALGGGSLPMEVLFQVVQRFHAEQQVAPERAALVKLVLLSQDDTNDMLRRDEYMVALDRAERNPAYLCGRLLAVLEEAQRKAIPDVNATVVDRFYGAASSAPVTVFGSLLSGAQPHLAQLRRDRPAVYSMLQREIEDILGGVSPTKNGHGAGFPSTLNLHDEGIFALGYYHQRVALQSAPALRGGPAHATVATGLLSG